MPKRSKQLYKAKKIQAQQELAAAKCYAKQSTIPSIGLGLFAKTVISKGETIAEYRGKLYARGQRPPENKSIIFFNDDSLLSCFPDDLASYANDCIDFETIKQNRRPLLASISKEEPFYKKHAGTQVNASILLDDPRHRAFLIAETDISENEEIFLHYGFVYWFEQELKVLGFENDLEHNLNISNRPEMQGVAIPNLFTDYPGFTSYVHEFYNNVVKIDAQKNNQTADSYDVVIHFQSDEKGSTYIFIPIPDYQLLGRQIETRMRENADWETDDN